MKDEAGSNMAHIKQKRKSQRFNVIEKTHRKYKALCRLG
jgi:hypothetical protein